VYKTTSHQSQGSYKYYNVTTSYYRTSCIHARQTNVPKELQDHCYKLVLYSPALVRAYLVNYLPLSLCFAVLLADISIVSRPDNRKYI